MSRQCPRCGRKWHTADTTKDVLRCEDCGEKITKEHEIETKK